MCRPRGSSLTDHPRIRGEHAPVGAGAGLSVGSSPHTRGARTVRGHYGTYRRIIPAYAGSTVSRSAPFPRSTDHPRIRGEHPTFRFPPNHLKGSSPHTRGAQIRYPQSRKPDRIIPAYAGSTPRTCPPAGRPGDHPRIRGEHVRDVPPANAVKDHPRIRGEHPESVTEDSDQAGSSPHTRGARKSSSPHPWFPRIIPAYAGSTSAHR